MNETSTTGSRAGAFGAWGLLSGLVGSLCCIGPSAAVLLGLGSSSALFGLQFSHTLALAGGAALLGGAAFALTRGHACALLPAARRRRLALMLAAFALSYGLLGVLVPALAARRADASQVSTGAPEAAPVAAPALRRATLIVEKMECPPCAASIRSLLMRKPFVKHFVAETYNQQVIVDYDSRQIDARGLLALIPHRTRPSLVADEPLP